MTVKLNQALLMQLGLSRADVAALRALLVRSGGSSDTVITSSDNQMQFEEYAITPPEAIEALRGIDELRNELAASRADMQAVRGRIDELTAQLEAAGPNLTGLFGKSGGATSGPISAVCSAAGGSSQAFNLFDNTGSYGIGMGPTSAEGYINYASGTASTAIYGHRWNVNGVEKMRLDGTGMLRLTGALAVTGAFGINGAVPPARPAITGSRGTNAALASLLTALATYGLLTDSTT